MSVAVTRAPGTAGEQRGRHPNRHQPREAPSLRSPGCDSDSSVQWPAGGAARAARRSSPRAAMAAPTAARGRGEQDRYETTRGDHGWVLRRLMGVGGSAGARELGGANRRARNRSIGPSPHRTARSKLVGALTDPGACGELHHGGPAREGTAPRESACRRLTAVRLPRGACQALSSTSTASRYASGAWFALTAFRVVSGSSPGEQSCCNESEACACSRRHCCR